MKSPTCWLVLAALLGVSLIARVRAAAPDVSTMDQLHQMYDDKKYDDLVKRIAYILTLHNDVGRGYDHYELYMLKGEAQMGRKQPVAASDAFLQAAKETTDAKQHGMAVAMGELAKRSPLMKFTPQTGAAKGQPIDITDPQGRQPAFAALYADQSAAAKTVISAATSATSFDPMFEAIPWLKRLAALEIAATGSSTQTDALCQQIGAHANDLVGTVVDNYAGRVSAIDQSAQTTISVNGPNGQAASGQQGLTSKDMKELKGIISTCAQITPAVKELAEGTGDKDLDALAAKSEKCQQDATRVLHTGYGGGWSTGTTGTGGTNMHTVGP